MADEAREEKLIEVDARIRLATSPLVGTLEDLLPEERVYVEKSVASRQVDFASGRVLARRLLAEMGIEVRAIARDADRVPIWPEDTLGSISHTDGCCVVAVSRDESILGLGVDVEMDVPRTHRFLERIATRRERGADGDAASVLAKATRIFSVKEAVYKACYPVVREVWGFQQVEIEFADSARAFEARVPSSVAGRVHGWIDDAGGRVMSVALWER